jgi:uncharacterized membrane protein
MNRNELIRAILGQLVRYLTLLIAGVLVRHNIPFADQIVSYLQTHDAQIVAYISTAVVFTWGVWLKFWHKRKVNTALTLKANASTEELKQALRLNPVDAAP